MCCLKKFSVFFVIMTLEALMRIGNGESFTPKVVEVVVKALLCTNMKATQSHSEEIELTAIVIDKKPFFGLFNDAMLFTYPSLALGYYTKIRSCFANKQILVEG